MIGGGGGGGWGFFFNDTATTEIYTLSLHDALPIFISKSSKVAPDTISDPFIVKHPPLSWRICNIGFQLFLPVACGQLATTEEWHKVSKVCHQYKCQKLDTVRDLRPFKTMHIGDGYGL